MYTLAWPMLPVNLPRAIAGGLCLVCTTLAPLPSPAFTYDVRAGSVIVQHQSTGTPLVWPTPPIAIRLELDFLPIVNPNMKIFHLSMSTFCPPCIRLES